ncbi:LysR substrate-binding domain-containing protein [Bosea sp. WAO]|uniref:LysR substrate-binding domain-containing protein n=1 Tax=Bosea sp. WAO TaxID=406341 RepID=UPI00082D325E|nr:LysR substrate-binding domain-containing protein [Bosea sp. WAO]
MEKRVAGKVGARQAPSLRELEILQAMIATRKTVAAAQMLGISQPAVSRALATLEAHVGRPLFLREGGRLVPTGDAFALEAEAQPVFDALQRLAGWPGQTAMASVLRIAAATTLAQFVLPPVLAHFRIQEPDVVANVEIGTSTSVIALVADRAADIGLVDVPVPHIGVRNEVFREAVAHVVMPEDHPLAAHALIAPRDLADEPLIAAARRFPVRFEADRAFADAGVAPRLVAEGATATFMAELVRQRVGLALLNPFPLTLGGMQGLAARRFAPRIVYRTSLLFPATGPVVPAARRFADLLRAWQPEDGLTTPIR